MKEENLNDFITITECYKILKSYKYGEIDEKACLIQIAKKFELLK
jgi:hypothetical protein